MKMAKYPTVKEYQSKPIKGIQRCDELLKKTPNDLQLLSIKLQLQCLIPDQEAAEQTLQALLERPSPVQSLQDVTTIEQAITELQRSVYPPPLTAGPQIAKLWENAAKTATSDQKLDFHSLRYSHAVIDLRLVDAQQSLIQLKALMPKNRTMYMAHAAITQLLSKSNEDLQARLALSLARKAVKEKFDEDTQLDCRVPGQIFALQRSQEDLNSIKGRSFADSKQVFRATRPVEQLHSNGVSESIDPVESSPRQWLSAEIDALRKQLDQICLAEAPLEHQLVTFTAATIEAFVLAVQDLALQNSRSAAELVFLATTATVKLWSLQQDSAHLLRAAFLTECLLSYQPRVHEAKIFLVYAYSRLGLLSLAAKQWDELSIKEIQLDTVGHVFLTRLASSHPQPFKLKKMAIPDPQRILADALKMYPRVGDKLAESHASVLNTGQTGMIFDLFDLRESLRKSVTRRIISIEQRRLARLTGKGLNEQFVHIHPQAVAAWLDTIDSRDFNTSFGTAQGTERGVYGNGNVHAWLLYGLATDSAWCLIHGAFPAVKDTSKLLAELDQIRSQDFLTDSEYLAGTLAHLILQAVYDIGGESTSKQLSPEPFVDAIRQLCIEDLAKDTEALPLRVSTVIVYLDVLRLSAAFSKFAESKKAFTTKQGQELRAAVDQATTALQAYGKAQASALQEAAVVRILDLEAASIASIVKAVGRDWVMTFAAKVAESARDAWLGPAYIK